MIVFLSTPDEVQSIWNILEYSYNICMEFIKSVSEVLGSKPKLAKCGFEICIPNHNLDSVEGSIVLIETSTCLNNNFFFIGLLIFYYFFGPGLV